MSERINNGAAVTIGFGEPRVEKAAHVVERAGVIEAAFFGEIRELRRVTTVTIEGAECTIVAGPAAGDTKGTVRLSAQRVEKTSSGG